MNLEYILPLKLKRINDLSKRLNRWFLQSFLNSFSPLFTLWLAWEQNISIPMNLEVALILLNRFTCSYTNWMCCGQQWNLASGQIIQFYTNPSRPEPPSGWFDINCFVVHRSRVRMTLIISCADRFHDRIWLLRLGSDWPDFLKQRCLKYLFRW